MLAKIAPRFVIERVIQHGYIANKMNVEVLKQPFIKHNDFFVLHDSKKFYECQFYSFIANQAKPSQFYSKYEQETYNKAYHELNQFGQTYAVYQKLTQFAWEAMKLYSFVQKNNSSSNFFAKHFETNETFEADVIDAVKRYNQLLGYLESMPEWQDKVKQEIGKYFHLIYNNLAESSTKRQIFAFLDKQEMFI